jgi:hypothetical protein
MADLDQLAEDTAEALLTAIKKAAETTKTPSYLLQLAQAYALVVEPNSASISYSDDEQ